MTLRSDATARIRPLTVSILPARLLPPGGATAAALDGALRAVTASIDDAVSLFDAHRTDVHALIGELDAIDEGLARALGRGEGAP